MYHLLKSYHTAWALWLSQKPAWLLRPCVHEASLDDWSDVALCVLKFLLMLQHRHRHEVTPYLGSLTSYGQRAWVLGAPRRVQNTSVPSTCPSGSSRSPTGVQLQAGVERLAECSYALPACQTLLRSVFTEMAVLCHLSCSPASRFIFHLLILERHLKLSPFFICGETQDDDIDSKTNCTEIGKEWLSPKRHGTFIRPNQILWEKLCRSRVFWGNQAFRTNSLVRHVMICGPSTRHKYCFQWLIDENISHIPIRTKNLNALEDRIRFGTCDVNVQDDPQTFKLSVDTVTLWDLVRVEELVAVRKSFTAAKSSILLIR